MKMRQCNYFITANAMVLNNVILESHSAKNVKNNYCKTIRSFLPAVQFVAGLNVEIDKTFV